MDDIAVGVGEDLDLNVARAQQRAFEDQLAGAEGVFRLGPGAGQRLGQLGGVADKAHAAPAAAGGRLDHEGEADRFGRRDQGGVGLVLSRVAGNAGHPRRGHQPLGPGLVAHRRDRLGRGADEGEARLPHRAGEFGVLGQKAVAGMDRLRAGLLRRAQDLFRVEIAVADRAGADLDRLVGHAHMRGARVRRRVNRHAAQAHRAQGTDDPAGDLAPVGDQDGVEMHRRPLQNLCTP